MKMILAEIGFYEIKPVGEGDNIFRNQNIFYQFHTEGFEVPARLPSFS